MTILLKSMLELSITYHEKGSYLPRLKGYYRNNDE